MIDKMMMAEFVEDMCKHTDKMTVEYFLKKYHLTYDEYDLLKYTTTPAMSYKNRVHSLKNRLAQMKNTTESALNELRRVNAKLKNEDIAIIISQIQTAVFMATRPFEVDKLDEQKKT